MKKIEIRYPNDPEAQELWKNVCTGVNNHYKYMKQYVKNYKAGRIKKTIFNTAKYLCYSEKI